MLPNIIFILADDQRYDAMGCAGHPIILTPVIDELAHRGIRFTNAFVTTPICAASRASLLTGLTERTHGYTFGKPPLSADEMQMSYPAILKRSGYRTGFFGKFGVRMDYDAGSLFDSYSFRDRPYLTENGHIDQLNTKESIDFISERKDKRPFCLSVSFSSAHAEDGDHIPGENNHFAVIEPVKGMYNDAEIQDPRLGDTSIYNRHPGFLKSSLNRVRYYWRWDTPEKYEVNMKAYYGMISGIDHLVGEILVALEQQGLEKNTIIIYSSDNGFYMGDRGFAGKWSHFDESIHVPLIIYDPRKRNRSEITTNDHFVLNLDIPATILNVANAPIPETYEGKSLMTFFAQKSPESWRQDFFCEHLMDHPQLPKWEGVRNAQYQYARYFEQDPTYEFLHDLETDPDQLKNIADEQGSEAALKTMRKRCDELVKFYERN